MTPTSQAITDQLLLVYKASLEYPSKMGNKLTPSPHLLNTIAVFLSGTFGDHVGQLMASVMWLTLVNKYPNCAGWIMEDMDEQLLGLVEELCDAVNEVYLEIR